MAAPVPSGLTLPPWHRRQPGLPAAACAEANRRAPHLRALAGPFFSMLPRRVLVSRNIRSVGAVPSSAPVALDQAVSCPWIALNTREGLNALCFDIDHADGWEKVEDLRRRGCPRPVLVMDPWSGRSHAIFLLRTPVWTGKEARPGPRDLADHAARLLAAALEATRMPQVALVKNPWGLHAAVQGERLLREAPPAVVAAWQREEAAALARRRANGPAVPALWEAYHASGSRLHWHTIPGDGPVELRAVVAALADEYAGAAPRPARRRGARHSEPSALGRNCALFDQLRWWAYDHREQDADALLAEAQRINRGFRELLPRSEVAATARSVGRFMLRRYRPRQGLAAASRRGRDRAAGARLGPVERQQLAGRQSAAARAKGSDDKVMTALTLLRAERKPITQAAVAAAAGVSLRTVQRRWRALPDTPDAVLSGSPERAAGLTETGDPGQRACGRFGQEEGTGHAPHTAPVQTAPPALQLSAWPGAPLTTCPSGDEAGIASPSLNSGDRGGRSSENNHPRRTTVAGLRGFHAVTGDSVAGRPDKAPGKIPELPAKLGELADTSKTLNP